MWTDEEDRELVYALFDMVNTGNHQADNDFQSGFLGVLEGVLHEKLPGCGIKAKPHIESRVKTLKSDTGTVLDMVNGVGCSGFGWDSNKNMVVAEKQVWDGYMQVLYYLEFSSFLSSYLWCLPFIFTSHLLLHCRVIEVIVIYEPDLNSVIIIDHNVFLSTHVKSTFALIVKLMLKLLLAMLVLEFHTKCIFFKRASYTYEHNNHINMHVLYILFKPNEI